MYFKLAQLFQHFYKVVTTLKQQEEEVKRGVQEEKTQAENTKRGMGAANISLGQP